MSRWTKQEIAVPTNPVVCFFNFELSTLVTTIGRSQANFDTGRELKGSVIRLEMSKMFHSP